MKNYKLTFLLLTILSIIACTPSKTTEAVDEVGNPAAEGFNLEASDVEAIEIADEVMEALGGRKAWDNTRHICWNFFGRDELVWDKWTGNVRIDRGNGMTFLTNINDGNGRAFVQGKEVLDADSVATFMEAAKSIWINHSYWLVMPYKLKDSGVTLTMAGQDTTMDGRSADKLKLTFESVGRTPQNMYNVWVDKESRLVSQWAYYPTVEADSPRFVNPWRDYNRYGEILLSGDREMAQLSDIMVFDELPEEVFTSPEKPNLKAMMGSSN